jgi:hypothetical protein
MRLRSRTMIINSIFNARLFCLSALSCAMLVGLAAGNASAQGRLDFGDQCWKPPASETLEEMFKTSGNGAGRKPQSQPDATNAVLLLSNANLKAAYSAGLMVGWTETGDRPRFAAITAVGTTALMAPFLFIGPEGDQAVADIFNCDAKGFGQIAERAASFLDESVLAAIAREHDAGRRLYIGLPGSAARPETVWDMGLLAKSRHPGALPLARDILKATIVLDIAVEPVDGLKALAQTVPTNVAFRDTGAGQEFLLPAQLTPAAGRATRYYLIHNDRLFWDDAAEFVRAHSGQPVARKPAPALIPGYDVVRQALAVKGSFRYASPKTAGGLVPPEGGFDLTYLRGLFRYAYRQARMGKQWTREYPGMGTGPS